MTEQKGLLTPKEMKVAIGDRMLAGRTSMKAAERLCEAQLTKAKPIIEEQKDDEWAEICQHHMKNVSEIAREDERKRIVELYTRHHETQSPRDMKRIMLEENNGQ